MKTPVSQLFVRMTQESEPWWSVDDLTFLTNQRAVITACYQLVFGPPSVPRETRGEFILIELLRR